ncbi:SGNH/GDSL hydrolase family protein [Roseibacillus ishigakijimensis]|uniref:SGNH/GDSL hydrolase family protein n=1 Tax=Roseibacillus ishigakijimensis TaxID=454146 RepID=A0A934VKU1_9BACT|nr:SGNH/GDSL hydrolase family protein [Roseibacillus ishigakijimensis]MBK1834004.1 SGNH/GDSL hydrolase family protein [Roseibacillus ishigakijimensis]
MNHVFRPSHRLRQGRQALALLLSLAFVLPLPAQDEPTPAAREALPPVLLIGDSISLGYTPFVQELMAKEAAVRHHPGNAQHTGTGLRKLDDWLGDTDWAVIHFNWGLWDLCYRHPESKEQGRRDKESGTLTTPLDRYRENLSQLVERLKDTGATLIWAETTYVPPGEAGRKLGDELRYNAVAREVMEEKGIAINELNALTRSFTPDLFAGPGDVHYTPAGSRKLARQVTKAIREGLAERTPKESAQEATR